MLFCCIYGNRYQISVTFCKGAIIQVPQDSLCQDNVTFLKEIKFFLKVLRIRHAPPPTLSLKILLLKVTANRSIGRPEILIFTVTLEAIL
jgi:hypothetical protein